MIRYILTFFIFVSSYCLSLFHSEVILNLSASYVGNIYVLMDEPGCLLGFVDEEIKGRKIPYQIRNRINEQEYYGFSYLVPDEIISEYIQIGEGQLELISRLKCDFIFRMNPNGSDFWFSYVYKRNFLLSNDELIIWGEFKEGKLFKVHGVMHWGSR